MKTTMIAVISLLGILLMAVVACAPATYGLSTAVVGQGSILPNSGLFPEGEVITLTAYPPSGWSFSQWGGQVSGDLYQNTINITMDFHKEVYAYFTEEGNRSVSELLENPVYDTEVMIEGEVSLLGQLFCPCFELTSGGENVMVWHDLMVDDDETVRPPVSVEGIENGDWVVVTGELKSEGEYRALNDFWSSNIEKVVSVNASHSGGEVTLAVDDLPIVTLESNPTTGYVWTLAENSDESVLQEVEHEYVPDPTPTGTPVAGAGGEEIWTFKALTAGTCNISMEYIRPWEEEPEPAATFNLTVIVE